jgi:hypothetical protein
MVSVAMMAKAISAAISPYSMAVTPLSERARPSEKRRRGRPTRTPAASYQVGR